MNGEGLTRMQVRSFQTRLLKWFDVHARDLPWRRTQDPYAIWVSEIMLQQTRVAAVLEHYAKFMERFPTVGTLALAVEADVLTAWSGLGYYRRAKMLHRAAQVVVAEWDGTIPSAVEDLRALPGVGSYTAAAIASIAFGEAAAVVDGNVERVVLRIVGLGEQRTEGAGPVATTIRQIADQLLEPKRPGDFNQAMMELGATICLPRNPLCLQCPVHLLCRTRGEHATAPRKKMHRRQVAYALIERTTKADTEIYLEQRPSGASLMPGMWELPEVDEAALREKDALLVLRHSITNTNYDVSIARMTRGEAEAAPSGLGTRQWMRVRDLADIPLTGLSRKALKALRILPESSGRREKGIAVSVVD